MFSNLVDFPKTYFNTDETRIYKEKKNDAIKETPALYQGAKFKKYQNKIYKNTEKSMNAVNTKEGFENANPVNNQIDTDLTKKSKIVIDKTDTKNQEETINNIQKEYNNTLQEYQKLLAKLSGTTDDYLTRVNPNNPYLNKNIRFTTGHVCYVTKQGVVKYIPNPEIWNSIMNKNGCPNNSYIDVNIPWIEEYNIPGTVIATTPLLISGTNMETNQSCNYEGGNVYVNTLANNPKSSYLGCYNDKAPATIMNIVPTMSSTNNTNGFISYASSVYQNSPTWCGPWAAFDNNSGTWWHSEVSGSTNYDSQNGNYIGSNSSTFFNGSSDVDIKGEWLQINTPTNVFYTLVEYDIQGRQECCGNPSGRSPNSWYIVGWTGNRWEQLDYQDNVAMNFDLKKFSIKSPKSCTAYKIIITNCGDPNNRDGSRYCVQIATWTLYTSSDYGNIDRSMIWNEAAIGYVTKNECQDYALTNGYKYFGLQNGNDTTAACLVSNDLANAQRYGQSFVDSPTALWDSKTSDGIYATLNYIGSLSVINSANSSVFSSDNSKASPSNYIGCYNDGGDRRMPLQTGGSQSYNNAQCKQLAQNAGAKYYGLQNSTSGTDAQCGLNSDLSMATSYGKAGNCTQLSDGSFSGGGWSNAVFNMTPDSKYFLILQDDGNMCIYRGSGPNDNQGAIWCSSTNGKQQNINPLYSASKSKYGRNWMNTEEKLNINEFIGSNNGSTYLIMQSDGNLVLYTSGSRNSSCKKLSNGDITGPGWVNALYEIDNLGNKASLGKVAYVDANSELYNYPDSNIGVSNEYYKIEKYDSGGNDIPGAAYGGTTAEDCKNSCNNNSDCYGFVYANNGVCYPKTKSMYPKSNLTRNVDTDTYVRTPSLLTTPIGISNNITSIDSIQYQNYKNSGKDVGSTYGLANATSVQKQQLEQMQGRLNMLSDQLVSLTGKFSNHDNEVNNRITINSNTIEGFDNRQDYLTQLKEIRKKIKNETNNYSVNTDNILNDSNINVLKENYRYILWSIAAIGTVIISMNVIKNKK